MTVQQQSLEDEITSEIGHQRYMMHIDGKWVGSESGNTIDVINPATEQVIARVPSGTKEDVKNALEAAETAQKNW